MARLGDICTIVSGSTPKSGIPEYWDGDIKWITPAELNEGTYIINDSVRHITKLGVEKTGLKPFPQGTVILSSRAPIGKTAIAGCEMYCNQGFKNLICSDKINPRYLYWFLTCNTEYLNSLGRGATFKEISKEIVANIEIPLLAMGQQIAIAEKFEKVSELIALRKEQLAKLDRLVKSRFIELFGDTILNPFGWDKNMLGSVCDVRDGTHDSPQYYETGYPLVTSKNVTGGKIDLTDCSLICKADFDKINERSKVDIGDIIMPMIGTVGKPVVVDIEPNFAIKNVALIKFKTDSKVLNIYIRALLQSDYFEDAVLSKVRGGTQKFISLGDIRKLEVLVPPMEIQKQFVAFVEQTDKSKLAIQQSLDKLELLKKSLMQEYYG
ncbi:MAG: restriction endonuclease subunit S [Ruminococcaceae bacterium]|nr:restriction endonuclease subunit S [Oscillospiraceae bacterium]